MRAGLILVRMKIMKKLKNKILADFVIVGSGNIALRHLENICKKKPNSVIVVVKRSSSKLNPKFKKYSTFITSEINNIEPISKKSSAFICSPATMHIDDSIILAKSKFNLFIEKPLSLNTRGIRGLINIKNKYMLDVMVGYNLRFLDLFKKMTTILSKNKLGVLKHVHIYVGSCYKTWRKNINYKDSVTHRSNLGGGVINELSHEIDMMTAMFGLPDSLTSINFKESRDKSSIDDTASSMFLYKDKKMCVTLHQNITTKNVSRYSIFEFDKGTIKLDIISNQIIINSLTTNKIMNFKLDMSDSYVKELNYFLNNLGKNCMGNNLKNSINVINIMNSMTKNTTSLKTINYD